MHSSVSIIGQLRYVAPVVFADPTVGLLCPSAQIKDKFGDTQMQILKATLRREATLIQRNSFIYIFRAVQVCAPPRDTKPWHKRAALAA